MSRKEILLACGLEGKPNVEELKEFMKQKGINLNKGEVDFDYGLVMTPLELACRNGYLEIVEVLMKDPRVKINYSLNLPGISPFYTVCSIGHLEIVKYMLMNERLTVDFTQSKDNPFSEACRQKQIDVGKWILASGRDVPKTIIESTKNLLEKLKDKNGKLVKFIQLLEKFLLDPIQTRKELRKELGLPGLIFIPNNFFFYFK